jgi:HEPN domain-containing protein
MKPSTREWVAKAEEDYLAALDLARRRKRPLWSGVCFHAQQCAEKYLKANKSHARSALAYCKSFRQEVRTSLGLWV